MARFDSAEFVTTGFGGASFISLISFELLSAVDFPSLMQPRVRAVYPMEQRS
jgi:hypothetical protein